MKIKLTISSCHQATSKTSGKPFYIATAESPDEGGDWKTTRWTVMSDSPIPPGVGEFVVVAYNAMEGTGRARPVS